MPHSANDIDDLDEDFISKSEIKREMHKLQDFGEMLAKLSKHQRSKIPLTEELKDAMVVADKITNKPDALRRHIRHMAKILLETDLAPIQQALDVMANKHQQESSKFIKLEQMRDKLIAEGSPAIEAMLVEYSGFDRQKLRQLVRQATKEQAAEKPAKYCKELFAYIKAQVKL